MSPWQKKKEFLRFVINNYKIKLFMFSVLAAKMLSVEVHNTSHYDC